MQDFPTLFRHLSRATHSPWIVVAAAAIVVLFALAVAIKLWDKSAERAAGLVVRLLSKILSPVSRIPRVKHPERELALTPAQRLAKAIYGELDQERKNLKLKVPLPVSWKPVPGYSPVLSDVAKNLAIADAYGEIWPTPLVILGGAGLGKSVLAQNLALDILGEDPEQKDYSKPENKRPKLSEQIPVVFGLRSWEPGTELDEWLTSQLTGLNYVPQLTKDLAGDLIRSRQVLPILDGFDEITRTQRSKFLEVLNDESSRPLILTSRPGEYWNSGNDAAGDDSNRTVLADAEVIELTDLPLDKVCAYLRGLPKKQKPPARASSPPSQPLLPAWEPVVAVLLGETPPEEGNKNTIASLRGALSTPLMVAIARDIYWDDNPEKLLEQKFQTKRDAEKYLLENFVRAIYAGVSGDRSRWTPEQGKQVENAERPFRYLAAHLQGTEGRRRKGIAWWELGHDKISSVKRAILCGLAAGLVLMVANGIATFLAVLGIGGLGVTPVQGVALVLGNSTAIAVAFGLVHCLAARRADGVIQPSWVGLSIPWLRGNRTVDNRHPARKFGFGFACGSVGGGVAMLGLLLSSLLVNAIGGGHSAASAGTASPGRSATLLAALGMTLIFGVTAGNVTVLQAPVEIESAGGPLELLATDRRLALGGGAVAGVMSGAAIGCLIGLEQGPLVGLGFAVVGCATVWLGGAISVTAWGQWLICGRMLLPLTGELPWRTRTFLRVAHERGVLRQSGAFYQFRHPLIEEFFAHAKDAPPAQKAPSA